jgi:hypothetical protein
MNAYQQVEADNKARAMAATWGHQEAAPGTRHDGWFTFIHGQHGDLAVVESHFPSFDEGPGYFADREDFIWSKVKDGGKCSKIGVYKFQGSYTRNKHPGGRGLGRFVGTVKKVAL